MRSNLFLKIISEVTSSLQAVCYVLQQYVDVMPAIRVKVLVSTEQHRLLVTGFAFVGVSTRSCHGGIKKRMLLAGEQLDASRRREDNTNCSILSRDT